MCSLKLKGEKMSKSKWDRLDLKREAWVRARKKEAVVKSSIMQGAKFELEACVFFIKAGYVVYRNVAGYGADLVVVKDGQCRLVEVRGSSYGRLSPMTNRPVTNNCDFILFVLPNQYILRTVKIQNEKVFHRRKS
jgi:hypothetical protein